LGRFVGPFAGAVFGVIGGYLVARGATGNRILQGALFGLFFALVDVALLIAGQAPFAWLFVISNAVQAALHVWLLEGFACFWRRTCRDRSDGAFWADHGDQRFAS